MTIKVIAATAVGSLVKKLTALKCKVPEKYGDVPLDLYILSELFTETSIQNPAVLKLITSAIPTLGKKWGLQKGGVLYRGVSVDDGDGDGDGDDFDEVHDSEFLPGHGITHWSTSKEHAAAFGKVTKANIPDSQVVLNCNELAALLKRDYPQYYNLRGIEYEDEILVALK